jgi:hypothetical protein
MKWNGSSAAIVVAAVLSVGIGAQTGNTMAKGKMADMNDMKDPKDTTYTGCVEAGAAAGLFTLTHVGEDQMGQEMMKDSKDRGAMSGGQMEHDSVAPTMLSLIGTRVNLQKHLGHKVSVSGSISHDAMRSMEKDSMKASPSVFTVKSLKMIAASCS